MGLMMDCLSFWDIWGGGGFSGEMKCKKFVGLR